MPLPCLLWTGMAIAVLAYFLIGWYEKKRKP